MQRYNITTAKAFGVPVPDIRRIVKPIGTDHLLAMDLWKTGIHEARIAAALIADPLRFTRPMADRWTAGMENWAQCDACCAELFQRTSYATDLPFYWGGSDTEFRRRAGMVMIAVMAVHHKSTPDEDLLPYFPLILHAASDERMLVMKAVSWAARQIGKRSLFLHKKAIALAKEIQNIPADGAAWIARDIQIELHDPKTIQRLQRRKGTV